MAIASKVEFEKALLSLQEALDECALQPVGSKSYKLLRDASIQRFEFCVELSWKVASKVLGVNANSPKPVLREMVRVGLIDNIDAWFDFIDARNKSSHTYDEEVAKQVFSQLPPFAIQAKLLLAKL